MGNNQPVKDKQGFQEYQRLGPVKVRQIPDPQGGQKLSVMQLERPIESQKSLNAWTQEISRIDDSQSRQILLLPEKHVFQKAGMCGSSGHVNLTYENFPYVLQSEIKNRKKLNRKFLQTQMWYLLYNIIRAGNKFQKINKKIGDVNPLNVLINDDGQIKVVSTCSIPNQQNNFQKIVQDKNAKVYLAPQQLNPDNISKGQYPSNIDQCKAQVFSIGLTILSSGILQDCFQIYNKGQPRTINQNILNQFIGILKTNYSPYLFNTIISMLVFQPNQRRKCSQIYNQLYPYQYNILELQPFTIPGQSRLINSQHQGLQGQGQGQGGGQGQGQHGQIQQIQQIQQIYTQPQLQPGQRQSNQPIYGNINGPIPTHPTHPTQIQNNPYSSGTYSNYQPVQGQPLQRSSNTNYIDNTSSGYRRPI